MLSTTSTNTSFSTQSPGLQLAVDSTSLGEFKSCPRKYFYSIIQGWQPRSTSPHLVFGIALHKARETYEHWKTAGSSHWEALRAALHGALKSTWNSTLSRPWISDHPLKNRKTLAQTIVWYLDEIAQNDPLETVTLVSNGKPAVELSFRFPSGIGTPDGEEWLLCGHLDRIATMAGDLYVVDIKTSGRPIDASFFSHFSPDNQMSLYTLAGKIVYGLDIHGVIVDGIQVAAGFAKFQRGIASRPKAVIDEWYRGLAFWLNSMSDCARRAAWPMNDKSCQMYGGCQFQSVCSRPPGARDLWLKTNFTKRVWDPLQVRGDI